MIQNILCKFCHDFLSTTSTNLHKANIHFETKNITLGGPNFNSISMCDLRNVQALYFIHDK